MSSPEMSRSTAALADLPQLEHRTLAVTVHAHLRSLLVSGRVAPGERLSLRAVGQALGVSVMPVRRRCTGWWPTARWKWRRTAWCRCR
ncbi:GntR family transcriptional regulator [Pseudoroseomonas wenyumeiae]